MKLHTVMYKLVGNQIVEISPTKIVGRKTPIVYAIDLKHNKEQAIGILGQNVFESMEAIRVYVLKILADIETEHTKLMELQAENLGLLRFLDGVK